MTAPPVVVPTNDSSAQVSELVQRIMNSANWRSELEKTVKKNVRLQAMVRDQKTQLDKFAAVGFNVETGELKEGKLLTKDEAAVYGAFVELKLKPEDIKNMVAEHGKLKLKDDERKLEEQFADAAEALGYENIPALTRWLTREKLVLEFKDQQVKDEETGKKVLTRVPYVRPADDEKAALVALEDYIEEQVPEFVDIFKTKPDSDGDEEGDEAAGGEELDTDELVRRAASEAAGRVQPKGGKSGVRVPATRSASTNNGGSKGAKLEDLEKEARGNSMYRI